MFGYHQTVLQALSSFRSTTIRLRPDSLSFLRSGLLITIDRGRREFSSKIVKGAWDLTPNARLAFYFFSLVPISCPMGRNPRRRSNHRVVARPFGLSSPPAVLLTSSGGLRSFRTLSPVYPHIPLSQNACSQRCTKTLQTGGCPRLLSSDLYRLPLATTTDRGSLLGDRCVRIYLNSIGCRPLRSAPPSKCKTSQTNLDLVICRAVADLTPNFALPPVLDYHPSYDGSCQALKARPLLATHRAALASRLHMSDNDRSGWDCMDFLGPFQGGEVWDQTPLSQLTLTYL
jgi:hypothetical protein